MVVIKFPDYKASDNEVLIIAGERMSTTLYPTGSLVLEALTKSKLHKQTLFLFFLST